MNKFALFLLNFNINSIPQKLVVQESKQKSNIRSLHNNNQLHLIDNPHLKIEKEEQKILSYFTQSFFNLLFSMEFYKVLNTKEKVDDYLNEEVSHAFILNFVENILIDEFFKDRSIDEIMEQFSNNLEIDLKFDLSINEQIKNILKTRESTNNFLRTISDSKIRNCLVNNSSKLNEKKYTNIIKDYLKTEFQKEKKGILNYDINKQFYIDFLKITLNIMQNQMKNLYKIDTSTSGRFFFQDFSVNYFYCERVDSKNKLIKIFKFNEDFLVKFENAFTKFKLIDLKRAMKESSMDINKLKKNSNYKNYMIQLFVWNYKDNLFHNCSFDEKNLNDHIPYWYILIYYFLENFKLEGKEGGLDRNYQFYNFIQSFYNKDEIYIQNNHLNLYSLLEFYDDNNYLEFIGKLNSYGYPSSNNFYHDLLSYDNVKKYFQGIFYILDERSKSYFDYNGFIFFECIRYYLFNNAEIPKLILDNKDLICSEFINIRNALSSDKLLKCPEIKYIYSFKQFKVDVLESLTSLHLEFYKYNVDHSNMISEIFIDKLYSKSYLNLCFYNGLRLENSFIKLRELRLRKIQIEGFKLNSIEINEEILDSFRKFILHNINEYSDFRSIRKIIYDVLKAKKNSKDISNILSNYKKQEELSSELIYYYDIYDDFAYDSLINKEKTREEYIINHYIKRIYTMFMIEQMDIYKKITQEENNLIFNECYNNIINFQEEIN